VRGARSSASAAAETPPATARSAQGGAAISDASSAAIVMQAKAAVPAAGADSNSRMHAHTMKRLFRCGLKPAGLEAMGIGHAWLETLLASETNAMAVELLQSERVRKSAVAARGLCAPLPFALRQLTLTAAQVHAWLLSMQQQALAERDGSLVSLLQVAGTIASAGQAAHALTMDQVVRSREWPWNAPRNVSVSVGSEVRACRDAWLTAHSRSSSRQPPHCTPDRPALRRRLRWSHLSTLPLLPRLRLASGQRWNALLQG